MTAPVEEVQAAFLVTSSREEIILRLEGEGEHSNDKRKPCGFHLTRSKWDPYPWVGSVEKGSVAEKSGLRSGDCLLEANGKDLVGLRVKEIASLVQNSETENVNLQVWRSPQQVPEQEDGTEGVALEGPLPDVARRLASAVSGAVRALECPVCLESAGPPVSQCVHGHILCVGCRPKTARCPICRVRLGQGRCLLADTMHRVFQDAFNVAEDKEGRSLREWLFGKRKKHMDTSSIRNNIKNSTKPRQLLARLLLGGFDKAASAENLSSTTQDTLQSANIQSFVSRRLGELSLSDRAKSASTGELSGSRVPIGSLQLKEPREFSNSSNPDMTYNMGSRSNSGLLSVPQTPTWGGSTESVSNTLIRCPLSDSSECREMITPGIVLEHLSRTHEGPQIHYYQNCARLPLPMPLGPTAIYVLHHAGEIFFLKCEDEEAWVTTTGAGNAWEWTLYGWGNDGTEMKFRKSVAPLEDPVTSLGMHKAPLPKALSIHTIEIQLLESRSNEGLTI
ncbi:uncharacterized protein LOC107265497 isoform X2 [Cephus cinctus]|nr:uncharacterized protein LOC107265497 isoform X2 [Cephus cinctus]XP_015590487.1 uncharacterized protein LOC107265497 isoform X2 [Cephus cinctus]XP_015590488.1 uncharacterized protein LOC107265497 isoform X2 [Cephus cinctus]XP_024938498.1 uncharacterized protein LOC107265497 isoform X2 [Cephus cinctus]